MVPPECREYRLLYFPSRWWWLCCRTGCSRRTARAWRRGYLLPFFRASCGSNRPAFFCGATSALVDLLVAASTCGVDWVAGLGDAVGAKSGLYVRSPAVDCPAIVRSVAAEASAV